MPTLKQVTITAVTTLGAAVVAGIIGFLNEAHLELSFDKLKDFRFTDVVSYTALLTSMKLDVSQNEPKVFVAYIGENFGEKTDITKVDVVFKNFRFSNRIRGTITRPENPDPYTIIGFYNDERVVLAHRGNIGVGAHILQKIQSDELKTMVYIGSSIAEDIKVPGTAEVWITQCPIIMIDEKVATKNFPTAEAARDKFPSLKEKCAEFAMPKSLFTVMLGEN